MIQDPDKELVKRSQKGDKGAYGKLVNQYYEMVYAVSYGVLRQHQAAQDAAQEVFLKVFRDIRAFQGKSKFKSWLYRIAVNASIDLYRKRKPTASIDGTDAPADEDQAPVVVVDTAFSPRDLAANSELGEMFKTALEGLSPEHRAVLVLRELEGLSYEEIAEALEVEKGTVMSRLFYARKKVADILKQRIGSKEL